MLYVNHIDQLEPHAAICHFGGQYGKGGYLSFCTTAINNPHAAKRWDNTPDGIAEINQWAQDNGYDIEAGKDGYGAYKATLTHRETAAALAAKAAYDAARFKGAERGYIRFGDVPQSGFSRNYATGEPELGVSVFCAEFAVDGSWRPILGSNQQLGSLLSLIADDRPIYRIYGDAVGTGGDGEPVVDVTKKVRL